MSVATSLLLPDEISARLDGLSSKTGKPKDFYILKAVEEYLEDLEDSHLADQVMEKIQTGQVKIYSSEEVGKRLGLDS